MIDSDFHPKKIQMLGYELAKVLDVISGLPDHDRNLAMEVAAASVSAPLEWVGVSAVIDDPPLGFIDKLVDRDGDEWERTLDSHQWNQVGYKGVGTAMLFSTLNDRYGPLTPVFD